jgi:NAD(P)-dependent dehydrogenase (short-subunit alcohol dehydrogenase family)
MAAEDPGDPSTLFSVAGKRVLVTGGSRGIGYMIARGFLAAGATVIISARKADACREAAESLSQVGPCTAHPADVSTQEGVAGVVDAVRAGGDRLDVLVNNAGATWGAPLEEYGRPAWDKVLDVNVKAVFDLTVAALPLLRAAATPDEPSRVVNIGSVDGIRTPQLESYAYSASKAAVHALTRHLALRLAPEAITVNAIAPGPFDSKMMAFVLDDEAGRRSVAHSVPAGRVGRPDDMAGTAIYLASRAGSYLTGAVIPVDGGITAR